MGAMVTLDPDRSRAGEDGVIVDWILKLFIILLIIGTLVYEAGVVIWTNFSTAEVASQAANDANFIYRDTRSYEEAEQAARGVVEQSGAEFDKFVIDDSARQTSVTVKKKAATLFIHKIGPLKKYTLVTATETKPFPG